MRRIRVGIEVICQCVRLLLGLEQVRCVDKGRDDGPVVAVVSLPLLVALEELRRDDASRRGRNGRGRARRRRRHRRARVRLHVLVVLDLRQRLQDLEPDLGVGEYLDAEDVQEREDAEVARQVVGAKVGDDVVDARVHFGQFGEDVLGRLGVLFHLELDRLEQQRQQSLMPPELRSEKSQT